MLVFGGVNAQLNLTVAHFYSSVWQTNKPLTKRSCDLHTIEVSHGKTVDFNQCIASRSLNLWAADHPDLRKPPWLTCSLLPAFPRTTPRSVLSFWPSYVAMRVRPVSGTLTFSEVAIPKGNTSAIKGDVLKNWDSFMRQGTLILLSTAGLCFWLHDFHSMSCPHTLLAIYTGLRKIAAILLAISSTGLFRQSSRTRLGLNTW